jgi:ABC-type lipoprotein release transport system permease subunit
MLFQTSGRDPLILSGVAAILILVATAATIAPALTATRINPLEALRSE